MNYNNPLWEYDLSLKDIEYDYIMGVDEVGRGSLSGPIVACAIILHSSAASLKINDSKKLSPQSRENLYGQIINHCVAYDIQLLESDYIDTYGIQLANKNVLLRSKENVENKMDNKSILTIIDGNPLWHDNDLLWITKADTKSLSVAAASIIAKVFRDRLMIDLGEQYPEYLFQQHKGYGTKIHQDAIRQYGILNGIHRKSFLKGIYNGKIT